MFRFLSLLLWSIVPVLLQAQKTCAASVFFDTDEHSLTPSAMASLDALTADVLSLTDFDIAIEANTDNRGSKDYNEALAQRRADAVATYLAGKGVQATSTSVAAWGEEKQKNANANDTERQQNRRVDIRVKEVQLNSIEDLTARLSAKRVQKTVISSDREEVFTARNGTQVLVSANSFVFDDGTPVTGPVELEVVEAYDVSDWLTHGLSTHSDGNMLITGGMVYVNATAGGREVELADGASLTVSMPTKGGSVADPAMELFYGNHEERGINWKPTLTRFRGELRDPFKVTFDESWAIRLSNMHMTKLDMPKMPKVPEFPAVPAYPVLPIKPRAPKAPVIEDSYKSLAISPEASPKKLKKVEEHYQKQLAEYQEKLAKYQNRMADFENKYAAYEQQLASYNSIKAVREQLFQTYVGQVVDYQRRYFEVLFASSLERSLRSMEKAWPNSAQDFCYRVFYKANSNAERIIEHGLYRRVTKSTTFNNYSIASRLFMSTNGLHSISVNPDNLYLPFRYCERVVKNSLGSEWAAFKDNFTKTYVQYGLTNEDSVRVHIAQMMEDVYEFHADIATEKARQYALTPEGKKEAAASANRAYVQDIVRMGWINCDKFSNDPTPRETLVVNETSETQMFVVFQDMNSMMPMARFNEGYACARLPRGRAVKVVAYKIEDGKPQLAVKDAKIGDKDIKLDFKSMTMQEFGRELTKLNG